MYKYKEVVKIEETTETKFETWTRKEGRRNDDDSRKKDERNWLHEEEMAEFKKRQSEIAALEEASRAVIKEKVLCCTKSSRAAKQRSKPPAKAQVNSFVPMDSKMVKESRKKDDSSSKEAGRKEQGEDLSYWKITRADGCFRFYKIQLDEELAKRLHEEEMAEFKKRQSEIVALEEASRAVIKQGSRKKRAGSKLKPKSPKKLKVIKEHTSVKDEQEKKELRLCLKIVQDEDRAINYETLAVKSPIVD
nr:hypothetical protein [Tanacetum cinerariifolium]